MNEKIESDEEKEDNENEWDNVEDDDSPKGS